MEKRTKKVNLMITENAAKLLKGVDEKIVMSFVSTLGGYLKTYKENKINNPFAHAERMLVFYEAVDKSIAETISDFKKMKNPIRCEKGCSFCCYINVDISMDEGEAIVDHLGEDKIATIKNEIKTRKDQCKENYFEVPYEQRKCLFLENNLCSIYPIRPLVCRKYLVASDPNDCNFKDGPKEVAVACSLRTECLQTVLIQSNKTVENMYYVLNEIIEKKGL